MELIIDFFQFVDELLATQFIFLGYPFSFKGLFVFGCVVSLFCYVISRLWGD